jgi:hypothetical protein
VVHLDLSTTHDAEDDLYNDFDKKTVLEEEQDFSDGLEIHLWIVQSANRRDGSKCETSKETQKNRRLNIDK